MDAIYTAASDSAPAQSLKMVRRIGLGVLWVLGALFVTITALPAFLLFVATAVPLYLAILLAIIDIGLVVLLFRVERTPLLVGAAMLGVIGVSALAVWLSQVYATTLPITDAQGQVVPGSIATLEKVKLGSSEQWISIRSRDTNNPVLLFLAGGPGGSQLTTARHALAGLEEHLVVVNWE
jgi:hypothetical protein